MKRLLALWLSMAMLLPAAVPAQEKPLAAVGRVAAIGDVSDPQRQIISNRLNGQLSLRYDLISQQEYQRAEEEAFTALEADQCTEENCVRKIQEFLQVERIFLLQIVREGEFTQISLALYKGDARRVAEDSCEKCTIVELYPRVDALVDRLAQEDLTIPAQTVQGPPGDEGSRGAKQEESSGLPWWVWALGALAVVGVVALSSQGGGGGGGSKDEDKGSVGVTWE